MKIICTALIVAALVAAVVFTQRDSLCFVMDRKAGATVCYERWAYFNNEADIRGVFNHFVEAIANPDGEPNDYVAFSDAMSSQYPNNAFDRVRENFSWVRRESLKHIVEGKDYSALLLEKGPDNFFVLYYQTGSGSIYFDFDTEDKYLPIDTGWVNNGYQSSLVVNSRWLWDGHNNARCLFERQGVVLYTNGAQPSSVVLCDFGQYSIEVSNDGESRVKRKIDPVGQENVVDDAMRFMRWVSS